MQLTSLFPEIYDLHKRYGDTNLDPIYGAGCTEGPNICLVFMNPTARNVSAAKSWSGLKAPWIGTKHVWSFLERCNMYDHEINSMIQKLMPEDWTSDIADIAYREVQRQKVYITNLAKCTQPDARPLPNHVYQKYEKTILKEIGFIKPKIIISLGNQVSSILLNKDISISKQRRKMHFITINSDSYSCFPVHYPLGQGKRNQGYAVSDILWIMQNTGLI